MGFDDDRIAFLEQWHPLTGTVLLCQALVNMLFWNSYTKRDKGIFVFLVFFFFVISQITIIYQGSCHSSPCSQFNDSADVNTWMDRYGEITTRPILAPSTLLIGPVLQAYGYDVEKGLDIPLTYQRTLRDIVLTPMTSPLIVQNITFDLKGESLDTRNSEGSFVEPDDAGAMRTGYILSKLIALLSLPLWMLYAFLMIKGWKKRGVARVFVSLIFVLLCTSTFMSAFIIFLLTGTDIVTWRMVLGGG